MFREEDTRPGDAGERSSLIHSYLCARDSARSLSISSIDPGRQGLVSPSTARMPGVLSGEFPAAKSC